MSSEQILDSRSDRQCTADEAYCRLRDLLEHNPEVFVAVREGLAIAAENVEARVLRTSSDEALSRPCVSATALVDGWLIRATSRYWLLLPEAFELCEDLPSGMQDRRWDSITACWTREGYVRSHDATTAQRDVW